MALFFHFTGHQPGLSSTQRNLVHGCQPIGLTDEEIAARFDEFDEMVEGSGLEKSIHLPMKSYSSGMVSRLRFAIAACANPEILLVDETLNTGDAQFAACSKQRMDEPRSEAGCVMLVSQGLKTIREMTSLTIWLSQRGIIMDGSSKEVAHAAFTKELSKGNNFTVDRLRSEAMDSLAHVNGVDVSLKRSRGGH